MLKPHSKSDVRQIKDLKKFISKLEKSIYKIIQRHETILCYCNLEIFHLPELQMKIIIMNSKINTCVVCGKKSALHMNAIDSVVDRCTFLHQSLLRFGGVSYELGCICNTDHEILLNLSR